MKNNVNEKVSNFRIENDEKFRHETIYYAKCY